MLARDLRTAQDIQPLDPEEDYRYQMSRLDKRMDEMANLMRNLNNQISSRMDEDSVDSNMGMHAYPPAGGQAPTEIR